MCISTRNMKIIGRQKEKMAGEKRKSSFKSQIIKNLNAYFYKIFVYY